jgi:hypothetical protein
VGLLDRLLGSGTSYEKVFAKIGESVGRRPALNVGVDHLRQAAARLAELPARVCFVMPEGLMHMQNAEVLPHGPGFDVCVDLRMLEKSLLPLVESVVLPRAFCYIVLDTLGDVAGSKAIRNGPAMPIPGAPGDHAVIAIADPIVPCARLPRLPRQPGRWPEAIWTELYDEERQQLKERGLPFRAQAEPLTRILLAGMQTAGGAATR